MSTVAKLVAVRKPIAPRSAGGGIAMTNSDEFADMYQQPLRMIGRVTIAPRVVLAAVELLRAQDLSQP